MNEVIPGIYQLKIPLPHKDILLGYVNAYLVRGDGKYLLVDAGWNTKEAFHSLKEQLAEIGARIEDISRIVVTHVHPDHYGLSGRLKQLSGAELAFHSLEQDLIELRYVNMDGLLQQTGQWLSVNGVPPDELPAMKAASVRMARFVSPAYPDAALHGGETIPAGAFAFQVLWTPGHSPGHICLYEPAKKILLSGDHILPTITPNIGLHPQSSQNPLGDFIGSLDKIKALDIDLVLPGHENPFSNIRQRIKELFHHHEQRNSEILAAIKSEPKTAYQISTEVTWMSDVGGVSWQNLSPLDKRLAVIEALAHLEALRTDGKVNKFSRDSTIYHRQT